MGLGSSWASGSISWKINIKNKYKYIMKFRDQWIFTKACIFHQLLLHDREIYIDKILCLCSGFLDVVDSETLLLWVSVISFYCSIVFIASIHYNLVFHYFCWWLFVLFLAEAFSWCVFISTRTGRELLGHRVGNTLLKRIKNFPETKEIGKHTHTRTQCPLTSTAILP